MTSRKRTVHFLLATGLLLAAPIGRTQDSDQSKGREFGFHMGNYLPTQIPGVTEIIPFGGIRFANPLGSKAMVELGAMRAHALGVDYTNFSLSLRGDMVPIENFSTVFYLGGDYNIWKPVDELHSNTAFGGHFGTGLMFLVSQTLWVRLDMKFNVTPGVGLYLNMGFMLRARGEQ